MCFYKLNSRIKKMIDSLENETSIKKEHFLKELISSAYVAVTKLKELQKEEEFKKELLDYKPIVEVYFDKLDASLTIVDNGIGMNKNELISYTQTHPIDKANKYLLKDNTLSSLGFFSTFLVAKEVSIISKAYGEDCTYKYLSDDKNFTFAPCINDEISGTVIYIKLKDKYINEFTNKENLKEYIKKYFNNISELITISYHDGFEEKAEKVS